MRILLFSILFILLLPSVCFGALGVATAWDVRTTGSDNNGGGFDSGVAVPGTDYSQQDAAEDSGTDLACADGDAAGAFPGANPTLIDVLDTTTGNSSESTMANSDLGSGTIPAAKIMYIDIDVDPATDTDFHVVQVYFYVPES